MFQKFIRRPVLAIVVSLVIVFIGILSLFNLPITQFPSISPPKVNVVADYPGANNELMIKSVLIPLEQALNGVPGMKYIESNAGNDGEGEIKHCLQTWYRSQRRCYQCAKPSVGSDQQATASSCARRCENIS